MKKVIFHVDVNSAFLSWEACYRIHHLGGKQDLRQMVSAVGLSCSGRLISNRTRDTPPQSSCSFAVFKSWQEIICRASAFSALHKP